MQRRKFISMLGGLAAPSVGLSLGGVTHRGFGSTLSSNEETPAAQSEATPTAAGFNQYTEDYAAFCARPEGERIFYAFRDGSIVAEHLNNQDWKPNDWGNPAELPVPGGSHDGVPMISPIPDLAGDGPYKPVWESLLQYECPDWYRDAKFGIWNHWSPQCVPEDGDWYARNMYLQGSPQNKFHFAHYGSPTLFGYKDLCAQWTLLNWQPSELMDLYVSAGAKFYVALANHHDGFDTWSSKHHIWNAANIGPRRDVIGTWAAEARRRNLRFGVTVHQARNWWWFQTSHGTDAAGSLAGRTYDGRLTLADGRNEWWQDNDPQQLYAPKHPTDALPDISYVKDFYDRTRDLIDQHNPDLLYFDNTLFPLGWGGMNIGAYYYNHNVALNGGNMEGVINVKDVPAKLYRSVVADIERGLAAEILPYPWQSETCIGEWHYQRALYNWPGEYGRYLPPGDVIHWMADTVSKNGTFLLNVPGKPDGTIDSKERRILEQIGEWFKVNGEAIYGTRPWAVFGEGPHIIKAGSFQGNSIGQLDASDIRYTRNKSGTVVYAIVLGWPQKGVLLQSFGSSAAKPAKVANVELLGSPEKMRFTHSAEGLRIEWPRMTVIPPSEFAVAFKLSLG